MPSHQPVGMSVPLSKDGVHEFLQHSFDRAAGAEVPEEVIVCEFLDSLRLNLVAPLPSLQD